MKFISIEKKETGKYINRYNVNYETEDGKKKLYEMISRDPEISDFESLHGKDPGETPEQAAARELREETGLHLDSIDDFIPASYSAVGFSN